MEAAGQPIVTDGEQRSSSFATYPLTDTLGGTGLADCLAGDGQYLFVLLLVSYFLLRTGKRLSMMQPLLSLDL